MTQQTTQQPVKVFRAGAISAAIWRNEVEQDGRTVVRHSVRPQKRYRDKDTGEWHDTDYYFPEDLPKLELVTRKAYEYITLIEHGELSEEQQACA